jgi:hypothetical protein
MILTLALALIRLAPAVIAGDHIGIGLDATAA